LQPKLEKKIRYALQPAEMVTAISSSVRASLLDAGAASDKTRVVPNGVDIARFGRVAQVNVRRMLDLPADAKIILTVGNYGTFRGHEYLVHATRQLLGDEPRARLVIVGRDTEVLRPLIRELGLDDKVVLTGAIAYPMAQYAPPDEERGLGNDDLLAAIFAQSNVYVSAGIAEGSEGLSLALLEAMAAGLPIVATEISGNRDVIRDGQSGVLVAPGSPDGLAHGIRRVLANREAACKLRDAARKIGQTYAWRQIALQYVEVYREAAERRRASK
jgi:glycosyltransferase involved in cell wall biosynthesis